MIQITMKIINMMRIVWILIEGITKNNIKNKSITSKKTIIKKNTPRDFSGRKYKVFKLFFSIGLQFFNFCTKILNKSTIIF